MESPDQPKGFWAQLTPVSKFLIFLLVLGILGGSAYYIFMGKKAQTATQTSAPTTTEEAASDNTATDQSSTSENVATDAPTAESVATDTKVPEPAPTAIPKSIEAKKAAVLPKSKKPVNITKKRPEKAQPVKPKKKSKNNEDVEIDI